MIDAELLVGTVFSGLAALTVDEIEDAGEVIVVRARTRGGAVKCPACGTLTRHVHAFHERVPADVAIMGGACWSVSGCDGCAVARRTARGRRSASKSLVCWSVTNATRCD